jgi:hypothetical protein
MVSIGHSYRKPNAAMRFDIEHHLGSDNAVGYVEVAATRAVEIKVEPVTR